MKILINHLGYELSGYKLAVIQGTAILKTTDCTLVDSRSEKDVLRLSIKSAGKVDSWKDFDYWIIDFSEYSNPGSYYIRINHGTGYINSETFIIGSDRLLDNSFSDVLAGFKLVRSSGKYDRSDYKTFFFGSRTEYRDLHGGWYDASGDTSKYLSHLSYANYMNPQQIPLVVWGLLDSLGGLQRQASGKEKMFKERITEEALHGTDFLVRMQDEAGYFYMTLFDQWKKDVNNRMICSYTGQDGKRFESYQAGYRQGGGMAIAALARISTTDEHGDFTGQEYLLAAEKGFNHLENHNLEYLDNGCENIIDDYCALLAAAELFGATQKEEYFRAAEYRAHSLIKRISRDEKYDGWWRADDEGNIPYFHASDAGMPVISLLRFMETAPNSELSNLIADTVRESFDFELSITSEVNNPFGYARQYVSGIETGRRTSFFVPHDNWSGYWWQGENARIASLSAAASKAAVIFSTDVPLSSKLREYAQNQLNWILGLNPFDVCMIHGVGRNNPEYMKEWRNLPGGIANGITAGFSDERDIDFLPDKAAQDNTQRWRWSEQWLPHAIWYLVAISSRG